MKPTSSGDVPAEHTFPCPRCGKPSAWTGNPYRPFCRERCKLIDLGAWAAEEYRVPAAQGRDFDGDNDGDEAR